jgi:hypothetical protein
VSQGGFAKCYLFTNMADHGAWAGKVVSKSALIKPKAKAKVRFPAIRFSLMYALS